MIRPEQQFTWKQLQERHGEHRLQSELHPDPSCVPRAGIKGRVAQIYRIADRTSLSLNLCSDRAGRRILTAPSRIS